MSENPLNEEKIMAAAKAISQAKKVVVFSGAGMSAESGINTFRDPEMGLWLNKMGLALFGTPFGWWLMPQTAWKLYLERFRNQIAAAQPNEGHKAVAELESIFKKDGQSDNFWVVTQNVDGLHQRAGNKEVYELHGTIWKHICSKHHHPHSYAIDPSNFAEGYNPINDPFFDSQADKYPTCSHEGCSSYLRPAATLFTESLPQEAFSKSWRALRKLNAGDVVIVVGTSGVVYPAASIADSAVDMRKHGIFVIEINPCPSHLSSLVDIHIDGPCGVYLPEILKKVKDLRHID